jgi:hypothetical protein
MARYGAGMGGCYSEHSRRHRHANRWDAVRGHTPVAAMGAAARGRVDGGGVGRQSADGVTFGGPSGYGAGIADEGDKIFLFLAETLPKLRFLWSFHLFVITQPDGWVRREGYDGPDSGEKIFQLSSLIIV